jgi:hypothetical protein
MTIWKTIRIACAVSALAFVVTGSAVALGSHENRLTFNRPVALPGVVLPAGSYSFDTHWDNPNVVIVRNQKRNKVLYMGFTARTQRPRAMSPNASVTLGEAKANEVPPITAWYEIGQTIGHVFLY